MAEMTLPRARLPVVPRWLRVAPIFVLATLAGLVVGAGVVALVATRLLDYQALTVSSSSMSPSLQPADLIVVRPAAMRDIDAGDVVLFESGGDRVPTVHRVLGSNEVQVNIRDQATGETESLTDYRLVTQGDANPAPDSGEVTAGEFRGEVWFSIPHAGSIANLPIQVICLVIAAFTATGWAAWELAHRRRREASS